jgi:hypothetical protein
MILRYCSETDPEGNALAATLQHCSRGDLQFRAVNSWISANSLVVRLSLLSYREHHQLRYERKCAKAHQNSSALGHLTIHAGIFFVLFRFNTTSWDGSGREYFFEDIPECTRLSSISSRIIPKHLLLFWGPS